MRIKDAGNVLGWNGEAAYAIVDNEKRILVSLDTFMKQPLIWVKGQFATREQIVGFVANRGGGAHFTDPKNDIDKLIYRA